MKRYQIAVLGSHKEDLPKEINKTALETGREIAKRGLITVSGCSTGISRYAVKGAKEQNGSTIGISPFLKNTENDSITYDFLDTIVYSGFGYKGRNVLTIRSSDGIVIVNGGFGTLNEVAIAEGENKPIVVIENTQGCASILKEIFGKLNPAYKKIGFRKTPCSAIDYLIEEIQNEMS